MVRARKRFAQHFLEPAWVVKLVAAIAPQLTDLFIEIGPGRGAITEPLAARSAKLVAVEVDRDLAAGIVARNLPNVTVLVADVLDLDFPALARLQTPQAAPAAVRVAGNLPYNISSPILFKLLEASKTGLLADATLMLQKEVADRLVARPGTADYGVLTLSTLLHADVVRLLDLPPGAFRPAPKVRSSVVRLDFRPPPPEVINPELVVEIVRSVFTRRRKTMANALAPLAESRGRSAKEVLSAAGLDPSRRPETFTLTEYALLALTLAGAVAPK